MVAALWQKGRAMITLYRVAQCNACDEVQETLRELVVAHKVVDIEKEDSTALPGGLTDKDIPVITDGESLVSGEAEVQAYLAELTRDLEQWRKFQSDACYIDDKGKTC
jgi:hypothetical protein